MHKTKKTNKAAKQINHDYGLIGIFRRDGGFQKTAESFRDRFTKKFPTEKDDHFFGHIYDYQIRSFIRMLRFYSDLFEFLDCSSSVCKELDYFCHLFAQPAVNRTAEKFNKQFEMFLDTIKHSDRHLMEQLSKLSNEECFRVYEAMKCLNTQCNFATVVMAVSAVESRLHKLMKQTNAKIYKKHFEKATLGGLIDLYRNPNGYKGKEFDRLKKIVPEKHKPLIELLNTYRIFSAHAKEETISGQAAKAILVFSFLLLVDEQLERI